MTVVNLDLVVVQASERRPRRSVVFTSVGEKLVNVHNIVIPLTGDGVVGLHLKLPGTEFDVVHRVIDPAPYLGAGCSLVIDAGRWVLSPTPFTSYDPLPEILNCPSCGDG